MNGYGIHYILPYPPNAVIVRRILFKGLLLLVNHLNDNMKYLIITFALFVGLTASASHIPGHIDGNGNPKDIVQVWGLNGHQTKTMLYGETVVDMGGVSHYCHLWSGCSDITGTDYFIENQLASARRLVAKYGKWADWYFPAYSGWFDLVR